MLDSSVFPVLPAADADITRSRCQEEQSWISCTSGLPVWIFPNATRRSVSGCQGSGPEPTPTVTTWGATTGQILALRDFLEREHVTTVVMEATSDYWKPFFYLLEETLPVMLVNAKAARNIPGRKTDVLTELTGPTRENRGRRRLASARFCSHGQ